MSALVNIIIPVHNRPELTKQTLDSLFQNTPTELFNLVIVNDGSDDETTSLLNEYLNVYPARTNVILKHNVVAQSPGVCRNMACEVIKEKGWKAKYLYHSDNDVFFTKGWLEKLIAAFEVAKQNRVLLLGGGCHPYLQNNNQLMVELSLMPNGTFEPGMIGLKDAVSGYSQLMTWETWEKYGPFDETMKDAERKIMGSEDWAFCQKIIKDAFLVGSLQPEVVIHCGKTNTYGDLATGHETFKQFEGVVIK